MTTKPLDQDIPPWLCRDCDDTGVYYQMEGVKCHCQGLDKTEERKLRRAARQRRKDARAARRKAKELAESKTPVAKAVSQAVPKKVTFEDLDGDQLAAYRGIHEWWKTQQECGGTSEPLIIGGYAGTGKSTLLSIALPALMNQDGGIPYVKYCSYTGKAANVLRQKGLEAQTLHSLIYDPIPDPDDPDKVIFELKPASEIDAELIVVDEASMVPDDLRRDLESLGIPIIYTGDHGQLPPVAGAGNVMEDPHFTLEEVHRQAMESGIITVATAVREGKKVKLGIHGKLRDAEKVGKKALDDTELLASADILICHTNKTRASLNERMRKFKGFEGKYPNKGEKIICVKNNKQTRMFNGLILTVDHCEVEGGMLIMDCTDEMGNKFLSLKAFTNYFDGEEHPKIYGETMTNVFEFAYAITGHKSQGSQWPHVIVVEEIMRRQSRDMVKRWLYTAVTRASDKLTWISKFNT